ncbi:MAG: hypothetical protein LBS59_08695 [Puniceicoccales bacterium]|jgi:cytochrome c553|nr:hypothetical protein [Puniceicoccales bacterium]
MKIRFLLFFFSGLVVSLSTMPSMSAQDAPDPPEIYVPKTAERAEWDKLLARGIEKIAFVKRLTYDSNHYYTEYLNSNWRPKGNICVLSLKTGRVDELAPSLTGGVFGAFDISFDAKRIVFAYKAAKNIGYRLYEVNVDGTNLRQITFSPADEEEIVKKYRIAGYHHGTEDLDPCYLPDGGIAFISTRCHFGILCDGPDIFTTTVLYRMDADGKNMRRLTNSALSESSPVVLSDGRILYTRWEYVDKGAVAVKCLWAMNPDGTNSVEIYGNDVAFPTTMIFGRPIPDSPNEYVFTGTPHYPQNCVGTIVRINTTKDVRTRAPMTYMTPYTDVRDEGGFHFLRNPKRPSSGWYRDKGGHGPLFRESYPLSRSEFLVSHKPAGAPWNSPRGYHLYLLRQGGTVAPIYSSKKISSFRPIPLVARKRPPIIPERANEELAAKNLAECIVTNVYAGMPGITPGTVKYLRVLEQVPRPWAARRRYGGDEFDQQHAVVSKATHLGLKIQHGIVTVEADGSARFLVPAKRNIFLQALDAKHRAIQTERTYVNYMPGETRSCVGCHEATSQAPASAGTITPLAMKRPAELPYPQPGEKTAARTLSYARDVQPVLNAHCVSCHKGPKPAGGLNLNGNLTNLFNESYENLVHNRRLIGPIIGENHPKPGNVHYLPAKSLGSYTSVLIAMFSPDMKLANSAAQTRAEQLAKIHDKIKLKPEELLKVSNWVDTNAQYHGSYYGARALRWKARADFRAEYDVADAISPTVPVPPSERK